jgi:hypothetical protein
MAPDPKWKGKHCVFLGIRLWDAAAANFAVPTGSQLRACATCSEQTWVQASSLKIIASGVEFSIICFRCARKLPLDLVKPGDVEIVPEALPEIERMLKTRRQ